MPFDEPTTTTTSAPEYTPLRAECQYLVGIFFCSSIECILLLIYPDYFEVPVFESRSS
jgi:hypothetical protein